MTDSKYSTFAGQPTRGEAYAKLMHHLREAQDQANVLGHLHQTEDNAKDSLAAHGWRGVAELLDRMCVQVTKLAMNKLQ